MAFVKNSIMLGSGGSGTTITVVANYSALPDPTTVTGQFYWAEASQGTAWLPGSLGGTYYNSGMYYSNGVSWTFMNVPYQATQAEVNTGTNTDKFVTPSTLKNSSQFQYVDFTSSGQTQLDGKNLNPNYYIRTRWQGMRGSTGFNAEGFLSGSIIYLANNPVNASGATNGFGVLSAVNFATSAVAGNLAYYRQSTDATLLATNFIFEGHLGMVTNVTDARMAYYLSTASGANPTNVEPDTITNCLGICKLSTSNNLHIIHNDASGTATTIDLGANFTLATASTDTIWFRFKRTTATNIEYTVVKLDSDGLVLFTATGTITTDLPSPSTLLYHRFWMTNNATASVFSMHVFNGTLGRY